MKTLTRQAHVLDQQLALSAYLDALLDETTVAEPAADGQVCEETRAPEIPPAAEPAPDVPLPAQIEAAADHPGVPAWAGQRFQALLFEVAGLTLAVPLVKLKGVVTQATGLTPMPGQSSLFAGLVPYQGLQSRVVDTARFILPPARVEQLDSDVEARCRNLVMIDAGRWALACSRIGDVIELDSSEVKWRAATGKRPWLAGTVIERMCALLDIDRLCRELEAGAL